LRIQNRSGPEAPRSFWSEGRTTLRAVESMKAMAEAMMVEAITHLPAGLPSDTVGIKKRLVKGREMRRRGWG
jgi:hypothetical protein